jgi:type II secretory pathway component PulC
MNTLRLMFVLTLLLIPVHATFASEGVDIPKDPAFDQPAIDDEFELIGTIAGDPPLACFAFPATGSQRLARVHEMVGRYSVASIAPGEVLLVRDGMHYELRMSNAHKNALACLDTESREDVAAPEPTPNEPAKTYTFSKATLLKQAVTANELLKQIAVRPVRGQEDQIHGYFIDQVPPGSIIEEAGIQNGDVIVSIEGKKIASMRDAWSAFNAIKGRSTFEIVLLRDNKPVTVRYALTN